LNSGSRENAQPRRSSSVAMEYFHKSSERNISVEIQNCLVQFLIAWFSYLIISSNKFFLIYYIVFVSSGLGAKTTCRVWKGGDWI